MNDAFAKIDELAALLPEDRREAYRTKARADFAEAAGITVPTEDIADDVAVKLVFGDIPEKFRTRSYTKNPHPELAHHSAVLGQAKEIVNAGSRIKIADLEPRDRETLRQARRIVRANDRHPSS